MACELEEIWLKQEDFDCIGQVAKHCDWSQMCIYIREQKNLFLLPKIGYCLMQKIDENFTDELIDRILCGGEFEIGGEKHFFFGLKRVLVHASYAAYILRHGLIDTPFGVVQKLNQDSVPANLNELKGIKNEHYNNALLYFENFSLFLSTISEEDLIKECFVNTCGINSQGVKTQKRQYSFSNISKDDKF
jgi:hypothetical protein